MKEFETLDYLFNGGYEMKLPVMDFSSPIYSPKKHTVESYRSQQRKKKRK
jgi:hypothetical protein